VNNTALTLKGLTAHVTLYRSNSTMQPEKTYQVVDVPGSTTVRAAQIEVPAGISTLYFVKLDLRGPEGRLLSTNFYWQNVAQDDFKAMEQLPEALLDVTATTSVEGETTLVTAHLKNSSDAIAVMTHLQLHKKASGGRVLPVFYADNYISLVPGESRLVTIQAATKDLGGEAPLLLVDGFNVKVKLVEGDVSVRPNENADPMHWPASNIVPTKGK
jgi:mannosylglycoprotein endo-beta-mannosidase